VLHDVLLAAGLLVTIAVIYQVSRIAKQAVDNAVNELPAVEQSKRERPE
jgi:hypothetical protein